MAIKDASIPNPAPVNKMLSDGNFTYLDYATNIEISDKAPREYVAYYRQKLGEEGYQKACEDHALPTNFENMEYMEFLSQRRVLMAQTVRNAFERLCE